MGYFDAFEAHHLNAAAMEAVRAFGEGSRENDHNTERVTILRDGAPVWVRDCVREAHAGAFPCDWIYETLAGCARDIADTAEAGDDLEEAALQYADACVIYHADVAAWWYHAAHSLTYAQNVDLGVIGERGGVETALAYACAEHIRDLYAAMMAAVRERAEALADAESREAEAAELDALAPEHNAREEADHAALEAAEAKLEADASNAAFRADPHRGEPRGGVA